MKEHQIITDGLLVKLLDLYRKELETISSDVEYTSAYLATLIFANLTCTPQKSLALGKRMNVIRKC